MNVNWTYEQIKAIKVAFDAYKDRTVYDDKELISSNLTPQQSYYLDSIFKAEARKIGS